MNAAWFERPAWPMEWEIERRTRLMGAVRALPNGEGLSGEKVEGHALSLWAASNSGRLEELPRNRPASRRASEDELERLVRLAAQLADHIDAMHLPAVAAVWRESQGDLWTTAERVRSLSLAAKQAFGEIEVDDVSGRGAGRKVEAEIVAETAGHVFAFVTGRRPTLTVAPGTGHVSGAWPDFLAQVFAALRIDASVSSQARAVMQKSRPATGN